MTLIDELEEDEEFMERIRNDRDFATDFYRAITNMRWRNEDTEEIFTCTWRSAGGLVAQMRNCGQDYLHFYCSGGEGTITDEIEKWFNKIGYEKYPY